MAAVVVEGQRAAVQLALGLPQRVGDPARQAPAAGRRPGQVDVEAVGLAAPLADRAAGDARLGGQVVAELGREVVGGQPRQALGLRLQAADGQVGEALVVGLGAREQPAGQVALEPQQRLPRAGRGQVQAARRREVHEVVRLDQLLVARALGVEPARQAQARVVAQRQAGHQARREHRAAVDAAPVEAQAGLEAQAAHLPPQLQPGPGARVVARRVEVVGQARAAAHARAVGGRVVAVAGDQPAHARLQAVQLGPGVEGGPPPQAPEQLLAQGQVGDLQLAREVHRGLREAVVLARGVRAPGLVAQGGHHVQLLRVAVGREQRAGGAALPQRRAPRERDQLVAGRGHEVALLSRPVALEDRVGALAPGQGEERQRVPRGGVPGQPGLRVGEAGQVVLGEGAGHQVVVGAPARHQPRARLLAGQAALEHHVRVGQAQRGRAAGRAARVAVAVFDHQQGRQAVPVARAEGPRRQLEALDRVGVEGAHQAEQAVGVVDLDAVEHGQVLVGLAAAHRQAPAELLGRGHARQRLQHAEDVLARAGGGHHLDRPQGHQRRLLGGRARGADLDRVLEALLAHQRDLQQAAGRGLQLDRQVLRRAHLHARPGPGQDHAAAALGPQLLGAPLPGHGHAGHRGAADLLHHAQAQPARRRPGRGLPGRPARHQRHPDHGHPAPDPHAHLRRRSLA